MCHSPRLSHVMPGANCASRCAISSPAVLNSVPVAGRWNMGAFAHPLLVGVSHRSVPIAIGVVPRQLTRALAPAAHSAEAITLPAVGGEVRQVGRLHLTAGRAPLHVGRVAGKRADKNAPGKNRGSPHKIDGPTPVDGPPAPVLGAPPVEPRGRPHSSGISVACPSRMCGDSVLPSAVRPGASLTTRRSFNALGSSRD